MSEENPHDHRSTRRTVLASSLAATGLAGCLGSAGEESTPTRTPITEAQTPTDTATPYSTPTPPEKPPVEEAPEGLPGEDIEIQHLDREPPTVEEPYGSPDVQPAEPETQAEIEQFRERTIEAQYERMGNPEQYDPVEISTLEELSAYARADNVYVKMEPGTYEITRENIHELVQGKVRKNNNNNLVHLLNFKGTNSLYDLRGVEITFHARVWPDVGTPLGWSRPWETHVNVHPECTNTIIRGLTYRIVDPDPRNVNHPAMGASTMYLGGNQNMTRDVTIETDGSYPYGYSGYLGKGPSSYVEGRTKGNAKVNGFSHGQATESDGYGNVQIGTTVHGRSFGHVHTWRGDDMVIIDGEYTGETRLTDEILAETSGPAYRTGFINTWTGERIEPGYMISLTEQAFRTYASELSGKALNCTVDGARSGPSIAHADADIFISNMECHRTPNGAYHPANQGTYVNNSADIRYGPAIRILRDDNIQMNVEILPSPTDESVEKHRNGLWMDEVLDLNPKMAAWINHSNHDITLTASQDLQLRDDDPHYIVLGNYNTFDGYNWDILGPATNVSLRNETGLPVVICPGSSDNTIVTNGEVDDRGENNTIQQL